MKSLLTFFHPSAKFLLIIPIVVFGISCAVFVHGQTWRIAGSPPPDNAQLVPFSGVAGDNMGLNDHTATMTLDVNGHAINNVGGSSGAVFDISQALGMGTRLESISSVALLAVNNSAANPTVTLQHTGTDFGLSVLTNGTALKSQDSVQVSDGVQFGSDYLNILNLGGAGYIDGAIETTSAFDIKTDDTFMYVVGDGARIEKRYKADGNFDNSFGTNGVIPAALAQVRSLDIDDVFLYVLGGTGLGDPYLVKRNTLDGSYDPSFNSGAPKSISNNFLARDIAVDDSAIFVIGDYYTGSEYDWYIGKYSKDSGNLVTTFDSDGWVQGAGVTSVPGSKGIAVGANSIYVAGSENSEYWRIEKRDKYTGILDATFGVGGVVSFLPPESSGSLSTILIDEASDSIFLAGSRSFNMYVYKFTASTGSAVPTFGTGGYQKINAFGTNVRAEYDGTNNMLVVTSFSQPWRVTGFNGTSGATVYSVLQGSVGCQIASSLATDGTYMYIVGSGFPFSETNWRIEKRRISDGSVATPFGSPASQDLYWGDKVLCYAGQINCGYATTLGDGLGNHIAADELNMLNYRIYNVASTNSAPALMASTTDQWQTARFRSLSNHGVYASSDSSIGGAGMYAVAEGNSYAVLGSSASSKAAKFTGDLEIFRDDSANVHAQIQFGSTSFNALGTLPTAGSATLDLYWGDRVICDVSESSCAVGSTTVLPSLWIANALGIHADPSERVVIGDVDTLSTSGLTDALMVGHNWLSNEDDYNLGLWTPSGSRSMFEVQVVGKTAYIAQANGLAIVDVSDRNTPRLMGETTDVPFVATGIEVSLPYVYLATRGGFYVIDVSDPNSPSTISSYSYTSNRSTSNNIYDTNVALNGKYAYVVYNDIGGATPSQLLIFDLAGQNDLISALVGQMNIDNPADIDVSDQDLVLAIWDNNNQNGKIAWYDLGNPIAPVLVDEVTSGNAKPAKSVDIDGEKVLVVTDNVRRYLFQRNPTVTNGTLVQSSNDNSASTDFFTVGSEPFFGGVISADNFVYAFGAEQNGYPLSVYYSGASVTNWPQLLTQTDDLFYGSVNNSRHTRGFVSGDLLYRGTLNSGALDAFDVSQMQGFSASTVDSYIIVGTALYVNQNSYLYSAEGSSVRVGEDVSAFGGVTVSAGDLFVGARRLNAANLTALKNK